METVGGGVRTHVLQLLKNLDPERYELTLIYGERYDHVFESQREELAKHVTLILDSIWFVPLAFGRVGKR